MNEEFVRILVEVIRLILKDYDPSLKISLEKIYLRSTACIVNIETTKRNIELNLSQVLIPARFFSVLHKIFPGIQFWIFIGCLPNGLQVEIDFCGETALIRKREDNLTKRAKLLIKNFVENENE